jgi:2-dehydropantoate 2-reductase
MEEQVMKICVFGAGAIGGYMAAELALAGFQVSVVARGAHLAAIRRNGIRLRIGGQEKLAKLPASDDPRDLGIQDFVICTLKAHQACESAHLFAPLLGPHSAVVTAMNGIPWWYFHCSGGRFEGKTLSTVDPDGRQWTLIGPQRAIGCVVDPACEVVAPGVIEHHAYNRFILGEPDDTVSERVTVLANALTSAGFDAPVRQNIRWNVWLKLWGNVCFNPISLLTHTTLDRIATQPDLRAMCERIMLEAKAVADAVGVVIAPDMIARRLAAAGKVTGHRMSMLQDLERQRSLELDALVAAVQEIAGLVEVETPTIDAVLALARERGRQAGLYGNAKIPPPRQRLTGGANSSEIRE